MKFEKAKRFIMLFGKYRGERIDDIAKTDTGLLYLDWCRDIVKGISKDAIESYLSDEAIEAELEDILERGEK